jgi:hypothetical protein
LTLRLARVSRKDVANSDCNAQSRFAPLPAGFSSREQSLVSPPPTSRGEV